MSQCDWCGNDLKNNDRVGEDYYGKSCGFSVRCIKDNGQRGHLWSAERGGVCSVTPLIILFIT